MPEAKLLSDHELWEYVDGGLSELQRARIAAILARDPVQAAKARAMRKQNESLRQLGSDVLEEDIPKELTEKLLKYEVHFDHRPAWRPRPYSISTRRAFAIAAFSLLIGFIAGWITQYPGTSKNPLTPIQQTRNFVSEILNYSANQDASSKDLLKAYDIGFEEEIAQLFGLKVSPPDLTARGYHLGGARVYPAKFGTVVFYQFSSEIAQPVSVIFWAMPGESIPINTFSPASGQQIRFWRQSDLGFAVAANISSNVADDIANDVFSFFQTSLQTDP